MNHRGAKSEINRAGPETRGRTIRRWARFYDVISLLVSFGRLSAIDRTAVELSGAAPGDTVLDVGCGTGALTFPAREKVGATGEVHGIDASPEMIEIARRKGVKKAPDVHFQVAAVEDLPFPNGRFDLVLSGFVLHHLPEDVKRRGLVEVRRVLKAGGRFLAVDFGARRGSVIGHVVTLLGGHTFGDGQDLIAMTEEAGFVNVEILKTKCRGLLFLRGLADRSIGHGHAPDIGRARIPAAERARGGPGPG